jgi:hypothetical protein
MPKKENQALPLYGLDSKASKLYLRVGNCIKMCPHDRIIIGKHDSIGERGGITSTMIWPIFLMVSCPNTLCFGYKKSDEKNHRFFGFNYF